MAKAARAVPAGYHTITPQLTQLRQELFAMRQRDYAVHERIGPPALATHPDLAAVHSENAARLREIVEIHGWPDETRAGESCAECAWEIVYHLIDQPSFQRQMLATLEQVAADGGIRAWKVAILEDRIRASEGRPQKYGTRFGWDDLGQINPDPEIEDPLHVDERRGVVGLPTLAEELAHRRRVMSEQPVPTAQELASRRHLFEKLVRAAGWRQDNE